MKFSNSLEAFGFMQRGYSFINYYEYCYTYWDVFEYPYWNSEC